MFALKSLLVCSGVDFEESRSCVCWRNSWRGVLLHSQPGHSLWDSGRHHFSIFNVWNDCVSSWALIIYRPTVGFIGLIFHVCSSGLKFQVRTLASAGGPDNLVMLDPGKYKSRPRHLEPAGDGSSSHPKWQIGEQEFEALMRMLDNLVDERTNSYFIIVCPFLWFFFGKKRKSLLHDCLYRHKIAKNKNCITALYIKLEMYYIQLYLHVYSTLTWSYICFYFAA